ncbi:MAG: hypothetical protein PHD02_01230 [Bacilli bacterium]|nr:hypothetical protein [Bacilli bacterium]
MEEIVEEVKVVEKPKMKHKFLKGIVIFLLVIGLIIVSLGFIFPGLIWTRSLGIKYSEADYVSILNKLNYIKDAVPTGESIDDYTYVYGATSKVNVEFTSEEITAFFNEDRPRYYAVKNVQIRINNDNTVEAVASVNVDYFLRELLNGEVTRSDIEKEIPALGLVPDNLNLYIKFSGSVINNKVTASIDSATVQGIPVSSDYINSDEAISTVADGLNNMMATYNEKTGSSFDSIKVEEGKVVFVGSVPTSLTRIEK